MDRARLACFRGSPFARMARILILEWGLPVETDELAFPPPDDLFRLNPLGQVPVLTLADGSRRFPTLVVLEALWEMAGRPGRAYDPPGERQVLLTVLQAGDAIAAALYQDWAGLGPVGPNALGYDPGARHLARADSVFRWFDDRGGETAPQDVRLTDVAAAAILLWAGARGAPRSVPAGLAARVRALAARPSFRATEPQPWSPGA